MHKYQKPVRTKTAQLRLTNGEHNYLIREAEKKQCTVSQAIRELLFRPERIIFEYRGYTVDIETSYYSKKKYSVFIVQTRLKHVFDREFYEFHNGDYIQLLEQAGIKYIIDKEDDDIILDTGHELDKSFIGEFTGTWDETIEFLIHYDNSDLLPCWIGYAIKQIDSVYEWIDK
jgi:hypothetical protein